VGVTPEGRLDEEDFERQLEKHEGRIAIVAVTAASNVSGFLQPVHRLARQAHAVGAKIIVDAAQLAPHRQVDMRPDDDLEHLDFVVLAGHKMYAPLGAGALVGPTDFFLQSKPEYTGGGTVDAVTLDEVHWTGMPDRDEAGSPNVVGAMRHARHSRVRGCESRRERHQARRHPLQCRGGRPLPGRGHPGVRGRRRCAQRLLLRPSLRGALEAWKERVLRGDKRGMPGMVRASFGCYSDTEDVDRLVEMLDRVARGDYRGKYEVDPASGEYLPEGYREPLARFFTLESASD
jgi:selenocysteine lyase/cysteine desulfurase